MMMMMSRPTRPHYGFWYWYWQAQNTGGGKGGGGKMGMKGMMSGSKSRSSDSPPGNFFWQGAAAEKGRPASRGQNGGTRASGGQSNKPNMRPSRPKRRQRPRSFENNLRNQVSAQGPRVNNSQDATNDPGAPARGGDGTRGDKPAQGGDGARGDKPKMHSTPKAANSKQTKGSNAPKVATTKEAENPKEDKKHRSRPFGGRVWSELESLKALNAGHS
jgi:hypothetical protein